MSFFGDAAAAFLHAAKVQGRGEARHAFHDSGPGLANLFVVGFEATVWARVQEQHGGLPTRASKLPSGTLSSRICAQNRWAKAVAEGGHADHF